MMNMIGFIFCVGLIVIILGLGLCLGYMFYWFHRVSDKFDFREDNNSFNSKRRKNKQRNR